MLFWDPTEDRLVRSCDTNILFYACHAACAEHVAARTYLQRVSNDNHFLICELVLMELYVLLRNPNLVDKPMDSVEAARICRSFRANPAWGIIDYPGGLMDRIWILCSEPHFGRREVFDARLALTLQHHGVTELATRNTSHFERYGFQRLINPID